VGTAAVGNNVDGPEGARVFGIPDGFYWSKEATAHDADLLAGNIKQGANIFDVSGTVIQATGDATPPDVLTGKTFSNAAAASLDGTMPNRGAVVYTPTTANQAIAEGYHNGSGYVAGDADLVAGNIKQGVDLFGVSGTLYSAGVPKTGQTTSFAAGDDGDLERGVAWPIPRFTDNGNGTVTDNLTGLIWLKNADCFGPRAWATALTDANGLASPSCGLTDGSVAGAWRLPNVREQQSLIDYGRYNPALPSAHPFTDVHAYSYWTNTDVFYTTSYAWHVNLGNGYVYDGDEAYTYYVWPVRGGQ